MAKKINIFSLFNENNFQWIVVIGCLLVFIGFVCSRALASIGMIGIVAGSVITYRAETFKKYFGNRELVFLSLFFWIVFISGIYSDDKESWLNWLRIKLPFLTLPIAFAPLTKLDTKKLTIIIYGFVLTLFVSTVVILINYQVHYEAINYNISRGGTIPMPFSHIRYSLMLAFSFFCCIYLFANKYFLFNKNEKWLQVALAAFVFIALHILSVRSGLLALYLGVAYFVLCELILRKRPVQGILIMAMLVAVLFAAPRLIPSLHKKIEYMQFDLGKYQKGTVNKYSDAMRIQSMKIGMDIWLNNVWLGVGSGDLENEMNKIYVRDFPQITEANRRMPHNQFIWALASTGIIGLALFIWAFLFPLVNKGHYRYWLLMVLYIIIFSSFFTEDTFEEQVGTGFYLIFLLVLLNQLKGNE